MKKLYRIFTFENVTEALKLEAACKAAGLSGQLIPTPRALSSSCALSWRSQPEDATQINKLIEANSILLQDSRQMAM